MENFFKLTKQLKDISRTLINYSYPKVSVEEELEILPLKQMYIVIDGYNIFLTYSVSEQSKYIIECIQMYAAGCAIFIPFNIVCKIAKAFLGNNNLTYIEALRDDKKIYCWSIKRDKIKGKIIEVNNGKLMDYEGLEFNVLDTETFKFQD